MSAVPTIIRKEKYRNARRAAATLRGKLKTLKNTNKKNRKNRKKYTNSPFLPDEKKQKLEFKQQYDRFEIRCESRQNASL